MEARARRLSQEVGWMDSLSSNGQAQEPQPPPRTPNEAVDLLAARVWDRVERRCAPDRVVERIVDQLIAQQRTVVGIGIRPKPSARRYDKRS
jgi:hypothetical protein